MARRYWGDVEVASELERAASRRRIAGRALRAAASPRSAAFRMCQGHTGLTPRRSGRISISARGRGGLPCDTSPARNPT